MKFLTIRQTAATGIISEYQLRLMVKQNRCPGIYRGVKFMVNYEALSEQLDIESRAAVKKEVAY